LTGGYHIAVGGKVEESNKAQVSVAAVLPLMLVLTLTVLMIQLQRFSRLFLVLSVAPLGLIGVVAALLLSDKPLGFVALLGVLALTGMIARNSVILIDQIETEKARGRHPWDAVIEATSHRFRPILLTASAAILGMIPIAPTIFWGPMAHAIMGGLAVATRRSAVAGTSPPSKLAGPRSREDTPQALIRIPRGLLRFATYGLPEESTLQFSGFHGGPEANS
jgi:multidrug efflux pump subunit AcrB